MYKIAKFTAQIYIIIKKNQKLNFYIIIYA